MPVSYISAIRSVLDTYPLSKGLFREILQNSEDAKATHQIFVLDCRDPALLAYNNSHFNESDFKSLFNLWDSSKKSDTSKIGKFGMGFRSTFHITDTPQVLSQSTLAILDPLNENDNQSNVQKLDTVAPLINRFALDLFQPTITSTSTFHGTVVRLPLRQRPSPLSTQVFSAPDIGQLLADFIQYELRITLLFLTHLTTISIYEIGADRNITRLATSSITCTPPTVLDNTPLPICTASFVDLAEETIVGTASSLTGRWRILRTSFPVAAAASALSVCLGSDATVDTAAAVLAEHKLYPDIAIAASLLSGPESTAGRLFSFLPLPLLTHFNVHIHAPFALTPSREKLQNREETPARGSVYHISVEWNKLLFDTYLPQAWTLLLHMLAKSGVPDIFAAWPPRQSPKQLGDSGYWAALPTRLVETVVAFRCRVWPVVASPGQFGTLDDVLVAASESDALIDALAACRLAITHPPQYIVELLKSATLLTPAAAHASLLNHKDALALDTVQDKLPVILKYLLSTNTLDYIADLPIVPTPNGPHIALTHRLSSSTIHVLLDSHEYDLFHTCDNSAISIGHINTNLASLLRKSGPDTLNVKSLTPPVVLAYLRTLPLAHGVPVDAAWVSAFWAWLCHWSLRRDLYPSLADLPLLPTQTGLAAVRAPVFEAARIHPRLLVPLKALRLPLLPESRAFNRDSAARAALRTFRVFDDVNNIDAVLDALELDAVQAFEGDEEAVEQLLRHVTGRMSSLHVNEDRRRKLRAFPFYVAHPLASYQGQEQGQGRRRIRIPDGYAVFKADLTYLPFLPVLADTAILESDYSLVKAIDPNTLGSLIDLEVLELSLTHFASQPNTIQQAIVECVAVNSRKLPGELVEELGNTPIIVVGDGSRRPPRDVIDPKSPLAALYGAVSHSLPHSDFENENTIILAGLRSLNLMQSKLSPDTLAERIRYIACTQDHQCARALVRVIYETSYKLFPIDEIHTTKWLPTPKGLLNPSECRDDPSHRHLFDRVLSPLDDGLRTADSFRKVFGWDRPVSIEVLAQQLRCTLTTAQDTAHTVVCDIIRELMDRQLSDQDIRQLKEAVAGHGWVPVSGTSTLMRSEYAVFAGVDPVAGFHQVMFPGPQSVRFFTRMGCSERPSTGAILSRLSDLEEEPPSLRVAKQARRLLSLLSDTGISGINRSQILVPDSSYILRPLPSVFYNDIGDRAILVALNDDEHLAHDVIHSSLAKALNMGMLGLKYVDFKSFGIDMGEQLTTTIANKLKGYTPLQVMTEFVANASDAGATEFGIVVDEVAPPINKILSSQLAEVINGPSLVLYNNSVFTSADFDGICRTGVGGKSSRRDSIGQFGFGALTMFHLTDFAMIISGEWVLFIEPAKRLLPLRDRATLLLPLRHVRQMYPDHIKPLDGLYGFGVSSSNDYQGTLFRLPLRRYVRDSSLGDAWDVHRLREGLIKPFEDNAQEFLLFTSIRKIKIYHRTSRETVRTRMISSNLTEEMTVNEFKTKVFDVTKCGKGHHTKTQHWHVVSTLTSCDPEVSQSLIKYRLRSPITLAIAARIDIKHNAKKERRPLYKFFSSLPLKPSHLPVHISAPFILSDDRRQVRLDNLDPIAADYNRWLLSTAIPPLYLFLLSDLLEHGHGNIPWWPGNDLEEDELTQLVTSSFYKNLKTSHQRVFLPSYKAEPTPLTSADIVLLSTLKDDDALNQVFRLLKPPLVLLSPRLVYRAHDAGLTKLTPAYLSDFIRRSEINPAAYLQSQELNVLLQFLGQNADNLLGLPLLPLSSGDFGVIEPATGASQSYLIAPESIYSLFPDSQLLVHASFMSVLSQLRHTFNVKEIDGPSLKLLLATVLEERVLASHDANVQDWIASFWNSFADLGLDYETIDSFPLVPTIRSGMYTSLDNCRNRSAVILSTNDHAWLWPTLASLGLIVVERHSEDLPRHLRITILSGGEFASYTPFMDLLSAMATGQQVVHNLFNLEVNVRKRFADWCRMNLEPFFGFLPPHVLAFARKLPIWPTYQSNNSPGYQSADSVTVLPPGISTRLAGRFMNIPSTPYSPCFVTLKKEVLSFSDFFGSLNLPQVLSENDIIPYKDLLTMFLDNSHNFQSFETLRVPDTNLVLRHPRDLYAHDPLFISAFGGTPEFIHNEFLDIESRLSPWMKREEDLDVDMFAVCARALAHASSVSYLDPERARIVFEAYCEVLPLRIPSYQQYLWTTLDNIRFIPRDPSRRKCSVPIDLNPAIYAKPLPEIVSPSEVMLSEFEPIVWTQRAHFLHPPGERIHIANPSLGLPSFFNVVEHMKTLALRILQDFPSSIRLRQELAETYKWLNDNCDEEANASLLATLRAQPLFLNVADPSDFATYEWHTADQLLLNETKAVSRFHPVKGFLLPFEKLLRAAGVEAVVHPEVLPSSEHSSDSEQLASIRKAYQEMRQARLLTDVKFVTADNGEEEILPCHRTFLATYSSFFFDAFTTEMEPANLDVSVRNPKTLNVREYSSRCVSCALDFAYTGTIDICSEDLQLMIEVLELSDFWIMHRLHEEIQRLIVGKKLINIETCQKIEETAQEYHASFLLEQCQEYRRANQRIMPV